jgi:hypothetical protein
MTSVIQLTRLLELQARSAFLEALAIELQLGEKSQQYQRGHSESLHYTALAGAGAALLSAVTAHQRLQDVLPAGAFARSSGAKNRSSCSCS